jgi:hypothetical protein
MDVALDIVHVIDPGQEMPAVHELQMDKDVLGGERELAEPGDLHLLTSENPPKAIANYIDTHRNIVLAIYDGHTGENRKISSGTRAGETPMGFEGPLAVPLVVMRS